MVTDPKRVKEIFLGATEQPDEAARAAYLDRACGADAGLRDRVEALLRCHDPGGSFLGTPAAVVPDPDHAETMAVDTNAVPGSTRDGGGKPRPAQDEESDDLKFLAPSTRPDSLGRLGHYEVLQVLGKGGFGIVFRAFDETLQRVVAVKVMAPQLAATSPARKRFLREARSSAQVRHEHVVQVYAVEEQPLPYLVMEFIPGETLQQRLDRTGPLETVEVLQFGRQIAEGLAAAHATGLIHRDVKPANILIEAGPHQHVKITDFGLARAADDASLTQSGMVAGTPMFMAPEQARGETLDHRADLFSLGSVLYTMCSGRPPFRANGTLAVLKRVAEDTPRPIPEIIPEVPQWLCDIIARLQAKKPEDRFASAQEVAALLTRHLAPMQHPGNVPTLPQVAPAAMAKMPPVREIPEAAPALRPRFRTRRRAAAAAVLLLLIGGLGFTEATGVTNVRGTVIRLFSPEGTLVVEVDDPEVSVKIDGSDMVITGAGAKEIRLKPGNYTVEGSKDGKLVSRELITVTKNGRQVVRVSREAADTKVANAGGKGPDPKTVPEGKKTTPPDTKPTIHDTWLKAVALLPLDQQGAAVAAKLKERLPGFDDAFLRVIPAMSADRQAIMAEAWLKERQPAFAGLEDAWLKAIPGMAADAQVILVAAWLKECNPGLDDSVTHKIEGGVVTTLEVPSPLVHDLRPLRALTGLRSLTCPNPVGYDNKAESDAALLRSLEKLENINGKPVAQFWKEVEARPADFKEWLQLVSALNAEQQVAAVAAKLKERNPGFDGQVAHKTEDGVVTELTIKSVRDLSPVRALEGLKVLNCTDSVQGPLSDLSPLRGLPLTSLNVANNIRVGDLSPLQGMKLINLDINSCWQVRDLEPLKGMPLTTLNLRGTKFPNLEALTGMPLTSLNLGYCAQVRDLTPLKGMPLTYLYLYECQCEDLEPLKGMPLTFLFLAECTRVRDLTPLKGMPLTDLTLNLCPEVRDLGPLKGMPLKTLSMLGTGVTDLSPLKGVPLEQVHLTPKNVTQGLEILRDMKSLKTIGISYTQAWPAAEFWERYDKGDFKE